MTKYTIALVVCLLGSHTPAQADIVTIKSDVWCPYNCDSKSQRPGFIVEAVQKIFAKHGHTIKYENLNWARAVKEAREGKFEGILGALKDDAPDFVFPSIEQAVGKEAFVVKKGNPWKFNDVSSFEGVQIGVINDYAYGEPLGSYVSKYKNDNKRISLITGDDPFGRNLAKLLKGRIDIAVDNEWVINYYLHEHKELATQVEIAGALAANSLFVAFSPKLPKSKEYAQLLSDGYTELRKSGELGAILKSYGLSDWK